MPKGMGQPGGRDVPTGSPPRASWIVVPALNEASHIRECLDALRVAAAAVPGPVRIVVVDDGSSDTTAALAASAFSGWPGDHAVLAGRAAGVGWARRLGFEHALVSAGIADALIATTDADSRVAPDWLTILHARLDAGHQVVAGDVHLDGNVDPRLVQARAARLRARLAALPSAEAPAPHPHFAGANLAFRAGALRSLGPLPTLPALEDEALLKRCRALGIPVLRDAAAIVHTSARTQGRAPDGLATALALDALGLAQP